MTLRKEVKNSMKKAITMAILTLASLFFAEINLQAPLHGVNATFVENHIPENTAWTIEKSPYIVTSNIVVDNNATLTIQPGVIVKFNGNFSLITYGSIHAVGKNTNQITFTSNKQQPKAGDWNTIKFAGGNNSSFVMQHCILEYALNGVTIQSEQSAVIENSEIYNNLHAGINVVGVSNLMINGNVIKFNGDGIIGSGDVFSGLVVTDNSILYNNHGVYLHAYGYTSSINNIILSRNNMSHNSYGISLYSGKPPPLTYSQSSYITNFTISQNSLFFGEYGICLETRCWGNPYPLGDNSYIYNGIISNNTLLFNENGIYIISGGAWHRFIHNIAISGNMVASSKIGMYLNAHHFNLVQFDVTLTDNVFSSNEKGIQVSGAVNTNITRNSIIYNTYGAMYGSTRDNAATYNDIYRNSLYGMYVQDATVNAENNYWGDLTGPYHESNPTGGGDKVNGDGTDLDFTPFLTESVGRINEPPISKLQVDKRKLSANQTVTIDASTSSDDDNVEWYFFDFGDETNSSWITESTVEHAYSSPNVYEIQLLVLDNLGVRSQETATISVNVTAGPITLVVHVSLNSTLLSRGEVLNITVQATDGDYPVSGATVKLSSDIGGTFSKVNGFSDKNGYFNSTLIPPAVTTQTILTITANATKEGYFSGQEQSQVTLMSSSIETNTPFLTQALGIAIVILIGVATVVFLKRKRRTHTLNMTRACRPQCR